MNNDSFGIDKAMRRIGPQGFADAICVSRKTVAAWRRTSPSTALQKAIEKTGSQTALAKAIGVSQKTISSWLAQDMPERKPPAPANAVRRAVTVAGNQPKMAADLGVSQQCIANWCRLGYVPPARAQEIEMRYGVPRAELINPKLRNALGAGGEL